MNLAISPRALLAVFLLVASIPAQAIKASSVVDFTPSVIEVPAQLSERQALRALAEAFVMRSWEITELNPAEKWIDAEFPIRVHIARVRARLEGGRVTFHYRDSEQLEHGWRSGEEESFSTPYGGSTGGTRAARIVQDPAKADGPEVVHPKYLEWVEEVARTLKGTLLLQTLPD